MHTEKEREGAKLVEGGDWRLEPRGANTKAIKCQQSTNKSALSRVSPVDHDLRIYLSA